MKRKILTTTYSLLWLTLPTLIACSTLLAAYHSLLYSRKVHHGNERIAIVPPSNKPPISQDSIDLALIMFDIEVPENARHPLYDNNLVDRGVTTQSGWLNPLQVRIGREAFESWGILGSTLAHELEIHCQQSFTWINILDVFGLDGTHKAERQAYSYEISNAKRFGLTKKDVKNIKITMDYFYPTVEPISQ